MTKPDNGEPLLATVASWAVLAASFGLSATTWVALAVLAGFTATVPVFGITLHMAWLMPIAVDGYVVVALTLWMSPVPARVADFAKKNTYGAAGIGIAAQSAYHLLHTASTTDETWRVVLAAIVGALPPAVAGLAVHMRALIRRESNTQPGTAPAVSPNPAHGTRQPSTINTVPATPVTGPTPPLSIPDSQPTAAPAPTVEPVAVKAPAEPVPTPATVAAQVAKTRQPANQADPATVPTTVTEPVRKPSPHTRTTTPAKLAPSTTDTPVTESDAAQLTLPVVASDVLARAARIVRQYRVEHGTTIRPSQLARRLRTTSDEAAQALAVLNLDPNHSTEPITTVNGGTPR